MAEEESITKFADIIDEDKNELKIKSENFSTELEKVLWEDYAHSLIYRKPSTSDLELATELFKSLLRSREEISGTDNLSLWNSLGFSFQKIKEDNLTIGIISEIIPQGHGLYAVKLKEKEISCLENSSLVSESENVVQAPHRPSDLHTGAIACTLFKEGDFSAAAWSTTHRRCVDLAREPDSFFNSFTEAVASIYKFPKIVQLHAFDANKHNLDCDLIISPATKSPGGKIFDDVVTNLRNQLKTEGFKITRFPNDVNVLGGLKNINAKILYGCNPDATFFHVETNMKFRQEILNSQTLRNKFTKSFL